ncbi:cell filamentation protein Fic [Marinilabiliaceae bacterium JC017]|nr:cell filamentation protein Fic [Marinilabiliaceae bacterium JC017]
MSRKYSKYQVPEQENQHEVLPNFLGYTRLEDLHKAEFAGFLKAQYILLEQLTTSTVFNAKYILNIHKLALSHIYSFAGKLRTVNMSKGGFLFPSSRFLPHVMHDFEQNILLPLPQEYTHPEPLIKDIAKVHAELLFIHPFREANGRVARILANLMAVKHGYDFLGFYKIQGKKFEEYVKAVQAAAEHNYTPMEKIIQWIF